MASVGTGAHSIDAPSAEECLGPFDRCLLSAARGKLANSEEATAPLTPSRPNRRIASRRVMIPLAWSSATSSARYRWSSVIVASLRRLT